MSSKKLLLISAIVLAVVVGLPLLIIAGLAGLFAIALLGGIGIGAGESYAKIDDTPHFHTIATGPHWSPDGKYMVFESHKRIYAIDVHGTHLQSISEDFGEFDLDFGLSLSSDGTQIAYTAIRHEWDRAWNRNSELVGSGLDGSKRRTIVDETQGEGASASVFSPKSDRLAYLSFGSLYTTATDGSDVRKIVDSVTLYGGSITLPPVWSPNGEFLAFVARTSKYADEEKYVVYVVGADGSNLVELAETISSPRTGPFADEGRHLKVAVNLPAWSPDGSRLAFAKLEGEVAKIYTIDPEGSNPHEMLEVFSELEINTSIDFWHCNLSWSSDGSEILMGNVGGVWSEGRLLPLRNVVIRSDGSGYRELPEPGGYASWSPDGARIAVRILTSDRPGRDRGIELYTVARDGSDARVLVKRRHEEKEFKRGNRKRTKTVWILEAANGEPLTNFPEVLR